MGSATYLIGVFASLLACLGAACGVLLQKYAYIREIKKVPEDRSPWYKQWIWWLGFLLMVILPLPLDFLSLAMAPQSLLAPLASATLVFNAILAKSFMKEQITRLDIISTSCMILGSSLTTITGSHGEPKIDFAVLDKIFARETFIIYEGVMGLALGISLLYIHTGRIRGTRYTHAYNVSTIQTNFCAMVLAFVAGGFGGQQNIFLKSMSELIADTINGEIMAAAYLEFWLIVLLTIILALTQLAHLNLGLQLYDAVLFVPMYQAMFIVNGVIAGAIAYEELNDSSAAQLSLFFIGLAVCLFGVILLLKRPILQPLNSPTELGGEEATEFIHLPKAIEATAIPAPLTGRETTGLLCT